MAHPKSLGFIASRSDDEIPCPDDREARVIKEESVSDLYGRHGGTPAAGVLVEHIDVIGAAVEFKERETAGRGRKPNGVEVSFNRQRRAVNVQPQMDVDHRRQLNLADEDKR